MKSQGRSSRRSSVILLQMSLHFWELPCSPPNPQTHRFDSQVLACFPRLPLTPIVGSLVQLQVLRCLEQWVMHIELPVSVLMSSPVMPFAYQSLQNENAVEAAADLCVAVLRQYVPGEASAQVLQEVGPAVMRTPVSA